LVAAVFLIVTVLVAKIALGPQTELRQQTILRLYDLNCSFPFKTYRYPRPVKWLANGNQFQEEGWKVVLTCRAR
jgi:hypothetical protein